MKKQYLVTDVHGNTGMFSGRSLKAAVANTKSELASATALYKSAADNVEATDTGFFVFATRDAGGFKTGLKISAPTLMMLNDVLNQLGYRSVIATPHPSCKGVLIYTEA